MSSAYRGTTWTLPLAAITFAVFLMLFAPFFRGDAAAADLYTLTQETTGTGTGTISSDPNGTEFPAGTVVTLQANPDSHSTYGGWTGCDVVIQITRECILTMNSDRTVSVKFDAILRALTVNISPGDGGGTVARNPEGPDYVHGTEVILTPEPDANSTLHSWTGCDQVDEGKCIVTMNTARTVTVQFKLKGPIPVSPLRAKAISAGNDSSCAVNTTGEAVCWGSNRSGQLGAGLPSEEDTTTVTSDTAIRVLGLSGTKDISAGQRSCAVLHSKQTWCWGLSFGPGRWPGDYFGGEGEDLSPRQTGSTIGMKSVSAGLGPRVCSVDEADGAYCWGMEWNTLNTSQPVDRDYQAPMVLQPKCVWEVGMEFRASELDPDIVYGLVPAPPGWVQRGDLWLPEGWGDIDCMSNIDQISSGGNHSCARRDSGQAVCWGSNGWGQLGNSTTSYSHRDSGTDPWEWSGIPEYWSGAIAVPGLSDAVDISAGTDHSCAVRESGKVSCWGKNTNGQIGDGSTSTRLAPVNVASLDDAVSVSAGASHTCALRENGRTVCWGRNTNGQLGDGTTTQSTVPVPVTGLEDAVAVSAGQNHSCGTRESGQAMCWGKNDLGQLGNKTKTSSSTPVEVLFSGFPTEHHTLRIGDSSGTGKGRVIFTAGGIDCSSVCDAPVEAGSTARLVAEPDPGSTLVGWEGCDESGADWCEVKMTGDRSVTASFDEIPEPPENAPTKAPVITESPMPATEQTDAIFEFEKDPNETEAVTGFECRLDQSEFKPCVSPTAYAHLALGAHRFTVRSVNQAGQGPSATHDWSVQAPVGGPRFSALKIQPKKSVLRRGARTVIKVKVRNVGDAPATQVRVCANAPRRLVRIKACKKAGRFAPKQTKVINFVVRAAPKAKRGGKAVLRFRVVSKDAKPVRGHATVRIR